ncbi:MAG: ATP-binding cassette domain-containing protein [Alphaproteobacteria bacterium]|nr:ATP-binding cassette domain-containing protein [Alphaproteobacteria bacterium]
MQAANKISDHSITQNATSEVYVSPLVLINQLLKSQWLEDSYDNSRSVWLKALGTALHSLRWNGSAVRLSDVVPRMDYQEGVDDLLNALALLGFVAKKLPLNSIEMWRLEDMPLIAVIEADKEENAESQTYPIVITGWRRSDEGCVIAHVDDDGVLRQQWKAFEAERVVQIYSIHRAESLIDSSEEFARTQTGTSWMQMTMRRFRGLFKQMLLVSMMVGALTISVPLFVMMVYDLVIDAHSVASMTEATTLLMQLVIGVALAMTTESLLRLALIRSLSWFGARMQVLVGTALIGQFLSLPPALTERASAADQLARIRAFDTMRDFIAGPQMLATLELPWCLVLLLVIGLLGGTMVLVPMLGIAMFMVLAYGIRKPLEYEMYSAARSGSERQQAAMDMLTRLPAMKYAGVAEALFARYATAVRKTMHTKFRINLMIAILEHSAHALTAIAGLLTLVIGMFAIWRGDVSVGSLVAIMILTWRLLGIVQANCVLQPRIHYLRTSAAQINRLMSLKPENADYQREVGVSGLKGQLDCQGIVLRYNRTGDYVLRGLTLSVKPGQLVAIMGQSGAGKSSLLKILAGLYQPQAGSLRIDGINIRQYVPQNLRQHMVYMPQQPNFFSGTITENLRLLAPDATDEQLREAIEMAGAAPEIATMPEGLATEIGVGRPALPVSLAQRLNLARTYLQDRNMILLDELPFDVLNSASGENLYEALTQAKGQRTVVYATHRIDFAELADQVIWLRQDLPPLVGTPQQILGAMQKEQQP